MTADKLKPMPSTEQDGSMIAVCRHDDSSWCDHCPDGGKRARQALKDCDGINLGPEAQ